MENNNLTEEQIQELNKVMKFRSAVRWRTKELQEQGMSPEEAQKEAFFQMREEIYNLPQENNSQ